MKNLTTIISLIGFCTITSSPAVVILTENFNGLTPGATGGNTGNVQAANTATSVVVDAATVPAFTAGDGNVLLVSVGDNDFAAIRPILNPLTFAAVSNTDIFTLSFDLYIPANLDVPVGRISPRLEAVGTAGNGSVFTDFETDQMGVHEIVYTGLVSDFINGAGPADSARPFIFFEQKIDGPDDGTTADVAYIDNIEFSITPEPSAALLLGLGSLALIIRRRRR